MYARLMAAALMLASLDAAALCRAPHDRTGQIVDAVEQNGYVGPFDAYANYSPSGYPTISYGPSFYRLSPLMQEFVRIHECAHLALTTQDEVLSNCYALVTMRRRGLSPAEEADIEQFHLSRGPMLPQYGGSGSAFWNNTLTCAAGPTSF